MVTGLQMFWQDTGRADIGQALAEAALEAAGDDPVGIAVELANLGDMAMEAGELERAAEYLADALRTAARLENVYLLTSLVGSTGMLAAETGRTEEAVILLAAADAAYASTSLVPDPGTRELMDAAAGMAHAALAPLLTKTPRSRLGRERRPAR